MFCRPKCHDKVDFLTEACWGPPPNMKPETLGTVNGDQGNGCSQLVRAELCTGVDQHVGQHSCSYREYNY